MWIMLIKKLPTIPSPPKMSIFWAIPWPDDKGWARRQKEIIDSLPKGSKKPRRIWDDMSWETMVVGIDNPDTARFYDYFGEEPNWIGAVKIHYKDEDIRVFPHEYSKLPSERMRYYINQEQVFDLVEADTVTMPVAKLKLDPDQKQIYDCALLDGCNPNQANMVMLGIDISDEEVEFPPMGWFRLKKEYSEIFCYEDEMEE